MKYKTNPTQSLPAVCLSNRGSIVLNKRTVRQAKLVQFSRFQPARPKIASRPEYDYTYSEVTKYAKLWK
jgi:hypothetical protein